MNYTIEPLFSEKSVQDKVKDLARQISTDLKDSEGVVFLCLLKGAYAFFTDLIRSLELKNIQVDFLQASSYGKGMESTMTVNVKKDIDLDIQGKDVILLDDIIDTGLTLEKICSFLELKEPKSLKTCVLLDKPSRRLAHRNIDYIGFEIPDTFVVGYGIDYNENHRELPFIGQVIMK